MCSHHYRNFRRPMTIRTWTPAGRAPTHWRSPYTASVAVSSSDLAVQRRNSCTSTQQLSACLACMRLCSSPEMFLSKICELQQTTLTCFVPTYCVGQWTNESDRAVFMKICQLLVPEEKQSVPCQCRKVMKGVGFGCASSFSGHCTPDLPWNVLVYIFCHSKCRRKNDVFMK